MIISLLGSEARKCMDAAQGHSIRPTQKCSSKDSSDLTIEHVASSSEGRQVQKCKENGYKGNIIDSEAHSLGGIIFVSFHVHLYVLVLSCFCSAIYIFFSAHDNPEW